jgi:hypothetical protein
MTQEDGEVARAAGSRSQTDPGCRRGPAWEASPGARRDQDGAVCVVEQGVGHPADMGAERRCGVVFPQDEKTRGAAGLHESACDGLGGLQVDVDT